MTLNEAQRHLDIFLRDVLSTLDFQRSELLIYSRLKNEATASLAFPCRINATGICYFRCNVWLRFESLEHLLRGVAAKPSLPTIAMPLHLLDENRNFKEWQFNTPDDLMNLREIILNKLRNWVQPFIEQYSTLSELHSKLESANPMDWFILDPEQRVNVLAVIQFVQGDMAAALKTLDNALLERTAALPKKRLPIEAVRKRLMEINKQDKH